MTFRRKPNAVKMRVQGLHAIIIDDFHKSIANEDPNKRKAITSDVLTSYMMNLAEHNRSIRIPIIFTANELGDIYPPLIRIGRADIFHWSPTESEKRDIVRYILSSFVNNHQVIDHFFKSLYQNLWVKFGSGNFPSVWYSMICSELFDA